MGAPLHNPGTPTGAKTTAAIRNIHANAAAFDQCGPIESIAMTCALKNAAARTDQTIPRTETEAAALTPRVRRARPATAIPEPTSHVTDGRAELIHDHAPVIAGASPIPIAVLTATPDWATAAK